MSEVENSGSRLIVDLNVLRLVMAHFIAMQFQKEKNPSEAVRELAECVYESIDSIAQAPHMTLESGTQHARISADAIFGQVLKLLDQSLS